MDYDVYGVTIGNEEIRSYREALINKIFAILPIFEECEASQNFDGYYLYLNRIIYEVDGLCHIFNSTLFLTVVGILRGMLEDKSPQKKVVKPLTFHCISVIKGAKSELL